MPKMHDGNTEPLDGRMVLKALGIERLEGAQ